MIVFVYLFISFSRPNCPSTNPILVRTPYVYNVPVANLIRPLWCRLWFFLYRGTERHIALLLLFLCTSCGTRWHAGFPCGFHCKMAFLWPHFTRTSNESFGNKRVEVGDGVYLGSCPRLAVPTARVPLIDKRDACSLGVQCRCRAKATLLCVCVSQT